MSSGPGDAFVLVTAGMIEVVDDHDRDLGLEQIGIDSVCRDTAIRGYMLAALSCSKHDLAPAS